MPHRLITVDETRQRIGSALLTIQLLVGRLAEELTEVLDAYGEQSEAIRSAGTDGLPDLT